MINSHQFKQAAKKFRAGRISLSEFESVVIQGDGLRKTNEAPPRPDAPSGDAVPTVEQLARQLGQRSPESHKGDYGRVAVVGGSTGMSGAVALSGMAALRSGAGLVRVVTPADVQPLVAVAHPCLMTAAAPGGVSGWSESDADWLREQVQWADVAAVGPGMGRGKNQAALVAKLYASIPGTLVIDADGLNSLADAGVELADHAGPRILTPHPGEFSRLVGQENSDRVEIERQAVQLAADANVTIVLKGHRTLITNDGERFHNATGNPGMATAGSGDVLTGMVAAILAQGIPPRDACRLGVDWHGCAGDLAARRQGQVSMVATDIIEALADTSRAIVTS